MYYILLFAVLASLLAGFFLGNKFVNTSLEKKFKNQLASIESEVELIEKQADSRIVPAIHAVTKRIRGLL